MRYTVVALALLVAGAAVPQAPMRAQAARPKLVVVVVVDQMRADYLVRYGGLLEQGLKRLTKDAAWFQNAAYPYMETLTCVGHTTIGTGTLPYRHGIIQNTWYDRESARSTTCTQDETTTEVSYGSFGGAGDSAHLMRAPSLAETMRKQVKGRVITMSIKARSAIGLAGHDADSVVWLDERGAWQTSTAFTKDLIPWVRNFVRDNPIERDAGKTWDRTLPLDRYAGPDDGPGEGRSNGWATTFPHALEAAGDRAFYAHWILTPFADEYLEQMAEAAIDENRLGKGDGIDFLGVSFSTMDLIGHTFGPRSHEIQDEIVRLDRTIGRLLTHLDEKVGAGNYVLALSADHGVADIPEQADGGGGRVVASVVNGAIDAVLKAAEYGGGPFVAASVGVDVYLTPGTYDRVRADDKTRKKMVEAISKLSGVARVLTADEVSPAAARESKDPTIRAAALSYVPGRSGDVIVVPKPNWIMGATITTHGTLNPYDQKVPIFLFGAGILPGVRPEPATPADIAPTLASIAGVTLEPVDGKVLTAALKR